MIKWRNKVYDRAVCSTLNFYEKWVLPDMSTSGFASSRRKSLKETKLMEFRERKALLHPLEKK